MVVSLAPSGVISTNTSHTLYRQGPTLSKRCFLNSAVTRPVVRPSCDFSTKLDRQAPNSSNWSSSCTGCAYSRRAPKPLPIKSSTGNNGCAWKRVNIAFSGVFSTPIVMTLPCPCGLCSHTIGDRIHSAIMPFWLSPSSGQAANTGAAIIADNIDADLNKLFSRR